MIAKFAANVSHKMEVDGKMYPVINSEGQRIHPLMREYETSGGGLKVFDEKDSTARVRKAKTEADIRRDNGASELWHAMPLNFL